jgi:hypothetical protein
MQIDQTNLSIIRQLRDGRKSYKTIADVLSTETYAVYKNFNLKIPYML